MASASWLIVALLLLSAQCSAQDGSQDAPEISNEETTLIEQQNDESPQQIEPLPMSDDIPSPQADFDHLPKDSVLRKGPRVLEFTPAFLASISMIIVSELGDKTFFIAAIMAMRNTRIEIFLSAMGALALMTVLSSAMGVTLPAFLPPEYTQFAANLLFLFFGVRLLKDAYGMDSGAKLDELEEVESELDKKELGSTAHDVEAGFAGKRKRGRHIGCFSPVFVQCFTMTFLAEWGDRSQIATIAMAAAKNPYGVTLGGIVGHSVCTGIAVVGGKILATKISEKAVSTMGGVLFLLFAIQGVLSDYLHYRTQ